MNLIAIAVLTPALIVMVKAYGAVGGAVIWLALNAGYLLFGLPAMHKKLLKNELGTWIVRDVGIPAGVSLIVVALWHSMLPIATSEIFQVVRIVSAYAFSCIAAITFIPEFRVYACRWINGLVRLHV